MLDKGAYVLNYLSRRTERLGGPQHPNYSGVVLPGTIGRPWVLPRLEDRGQPPFLHELKAGNVGGSREGSRTSPLGPHAGRIGPTLALRRDHTQTAPGGALASSAPSPSRRLHQDYQRDV